MNAAAPGQAAAISSRCGRGHTADLLKVAMHLQIIFIRLLPR